MLFEELPIPLTFYDMIEKQDRFREEPIPGIFRLYALPGSLLPFQVRFLEDESISRMEVVSISGVSLVVRHNMLELAIINGYNYYVWGGDEAMKLTDNAPLILECGSSYYIKIVTNYGEYYSEVFVVLNDTDKYLMLEWGDEHDVDPIYYAGGYRNRIFLKTWITKGVPNLEIESEEDGFGNPVDISRKVRTTYDIALEVLPQFMLDAIYFMATNRELMVSTSFNRRSGYVKNVSINAEQVNLVPYWITVLNFEQDRFFYNTNCGEEIKPPIIEEYLIDQGGPQHEYETFIEQQTIE